MERYYIYIHIRLKLLKYVVKIYAFKKRINLIIPPEYLMKESLNNIKGD